MFTVVSARLSTGRGGPVLINYGPGPLLFGHVQYVTCAVGKAGGWHLTELPSCIHIAI